MKQTKKTAPALPMRLSMLAVACQLVCLGAAHAQTKEAEVSNDPVDSKQITITGKKAGQGLLIQEVVPKARSTVTAEELAKQRASGNAYSALELLPAVNTASDDATGLFGGTLTLRGFNSDQIGATINGVPVNDSGNFAVFPQEYIDQENTCSVSVTQGSTDVDSPQVGASGGNFNIVTCDPSKERNFRAAQSVGSLNYSRTFVRFDSGLWNDGKSRIFVSASHTESNKFKGEGRAYRDHADLGFRTDFDKFNSIAGTISYNRAINNNLYKPTLAQIQQFGPNLDYATTFQGHLTPVNGTAQVERLPAGGTFNNFYKLSLNPFENIIASVTGKFRIGENTDIKVIPYYWYGFGTGGTQERFQSESQFLNPATGTNTARRDLNGDGDTLDTILVASSNFTRTNRPGVTASVTHYIDNHTIVAGVWYERASHEQYAPTVLVDNQGNPFDQFLTHGQVLRPDGTVAQGRDQKTISTGYQFFAQDTISLLNDQLNVNVGVRAPTLQRDYNNYPNERTSPVAYNIKRSYSELLPQLGARYQLDNSNQLFASLARNFKAPPNTIFQANSAGGNVRIVNGQPVLAGVKAETSYNLDFGYRLQTDDLTAQLTFYRVNFKNRQASSIDPETLLTTLLNVGKVKTQGFELEIGNTPKNGWALYGSIGYADSKLENSFQATSTITVPEGNTLPLIPAWKVGTSLGYEAATWYARLKSKYTSTQQASLLNNEKAPAYTVTGFDAGYQFPNTSWLKKPTIRLNISNLFNETYRTPIFQTQIGVGQSYNIGAPRFTSVTFQGDF